MQNSILALLIAIIAVLIMGPIGIPMLKKLKFGQTERDDGPQSHLSKSGTPTMGGIMMIIALILAALLPGAFAFFGKEVGAVDLTYVIPAVLVMAAYGLVGFLDDFIKVKKKRSLGLKAYQKIIAQFGIALIFSIYLYKEFGSEIQLPFTDIMLNLGWFYIPFAMFVIIGTVNSVNLTDGLDGLASGVTTVYSIAMVLIFMFISEVAKLSGNVQMQSASMGLSVFAAATAGSCIGFLRYNSYPARVFMGDTGSMALGGAVSAMALMSKSPLLLVIMGICYVASSVSVILQVGSYKLRNKKRIFKMAPLHHHFELCGYSEVTITVGYIIVTVIACLVCLLSYM